MFKKTFLKKIKNSLLEERKSLILSANLALKEDVDMDGDEVDEIQAALIFDLNNKFNARTKNKINQINEALSKLDNNSYGMCDDCGEEISEKRLLFNPYFVTCISCAEDREIEKQS
jgi:DnaK suppressor protein